MNRFEYYPGTTEGPLGFPQSERQAQAVAAVLKKLPRDDAHAYRRLALPSDAPEIHFTQRADVSWISTEDPDRCREVVLARGMNDRAFTQNPIVTMQHAYDLPPVGWSPWRRLVLDDERRGIKARTIYPRRPEGWSRDWPPDDAFSLIQAELLRGKSIGFLPTRVHEPTAEERRRAGWEQVALVIDEWLLLEYACVFLPAQQHALVETVSKGGSTAPISFLALGDLRQQMTRLF